MRETRWAPPPSWSMDVRPKRRIRAALLQADLPIGMDLVVTAKPPAVTAAFADVCKDLERALGRVRARAAAA